MNISDIVNDYHEFKDYGILTEMSRDYQIKDHQTGNVFWVTRKEWYEDIIQWILDDLKDSDVMQGANYSTYARMYTQLSILEEALNE